VRQWAAVMRPSLTRIGALRLALALVALTFLALSAAGIALGDAGGGSGDFGGGGGGGGGGGFGGGGGDFGGDGGDGGSGGSPIVFVFIFLGFLAIFVFFFLQRSDSGARLRSTVSRKSRRKRVEQVELAAAEAAEDDERFDPVRVRRAADQLFRDVQAAWDQRDETRLATLVGPELLVEWKRHLAGLARKGWHNRVEVLGDVRVDYVGLTNREGASDDRVVVFVEATLRDYVENRRGRIVLRKGATDDLNRVSQYWTLGIRDGRWILLSIERGAEGDHNLGDPIVATPWADTARIHDEATIETSATKLPPGFKTADLADLDFDGDARAAALDLSLADPRFTPDVLEAEVRRVVQAWAEAVDGEDTALARLASKPALHRLLYQGDGSERTRVVVRGPRVKRIAIVALDAKADPATMTVEVELGGKRYVEDRDTASVLSGSKTEAAVFTERWTLALDGPETQPWRIVAAEPRAVVAHS
jgi:predicted lipid-binding transport protein (Tim44 family)